MLFLSQQIPLHAEQIKAFNALIALLCEKQVYFRLQISTLIRFNPTCKGFIVKTLRLADFFRTIRPKLFDFFPAWMEQMDPQMLFFKLLRQNVFNVN